MSHTISNADTFFAGDVYGGISPPEAPADGNIALPVHLPLVENLGVVAAADADLIVTGSATPGAGASLPIAVGTLTQPRRISITSNNAGDTGATDYLDIRGTDANGRPQGERITFNGAATVAGNKHFKTITSITVGPAALLGTITVGTSGLTVGLRARAAFRAFVVWQNAAADSVMDVDNVVSEGNETAQTNTNADQRAFVTGVATETLIVQYYPVRGRNGLGTNFTFE